MMASVFPLLRSVVHRSVRVLLHQPASSVVQLLVLVLACAPLVGVTRVTEQALAPSAVYPDPERLVLVTMSTSRAPGGRAVPFGTLVTTGTLGHLGAVAALQPSESIRTQDFDYFDGRVTIRAIGVNASPTVFEVLGGGVTRGRAFGATAVDDAEVLLSETFVAKHFGAESGVLGTTVNLGGRPRRVVGIVSAQVRPLGDDFDVWLPWQPAPTELESKGRVCCSVVMRLRPGVPIAQLNESLAALSTPGWQLVATPLHSFVVQDAERMLMVLRVATVALFLLTVVTIVYFQLVDSLTRGPEFAIMAALGASRAAVKIAKVAPGAVLGTIASVLGLAASQTVVPPLKHLLPVAVTGPAALSSTAITIAAACPLAMILIAWASLAFLRTTGEVVAINRQGEITTAGLRSLRRVMAMSMSAVAAATLLAAGFAVGEIRQISNANLGFDATDVYAAELRLTHPRFSAPPAVPLFVRDVAERVRALPGVSALSLTSAVPIVGPSTVTVISRHGTRIESEVNYVDPTFFSMLGIAATKGRVLSPKDTTGVAVISERFARAAFGDEDPLGQVFTPRTRVEVIGVVGNVVTRAGMRGLPQVYLPFEPRMRLWLLAKVGRGSFGDTDVRRVVASLDPVQPVERVVDLSASVSDALRARRTVANAVIGLALLTWLVAGVALYGGIIHAVMERRTDIGVRLALGGAPRRVGFMLAWRELRLVSIGVAAGLASMVPVRRLVESVLFGVHDVSPQLVGAVVGGLLVVSVAACAYPIARAVRSAPQRLIGYFN